ncbi:hypothetical protein PRIPAC_78203 [Pristionchus pacificus]|uniref:Uncharacterized protein n=1 Tax=Pristionchus pacificus TaxID=54126 RepID=A0A2A6BX48_PRIPA|nr:hypothetical protein PRIPAC_78203 [Pristionchus pacificus]|eukprot:PDM70475.1 hypothetical protein PRIPAC_46721 [Pristionchus pacificus]
METMVAYIMKDLAGSTDKQKASKIMETLKLIHTNDQFVVITYNSDKCSLNSFASADGGSNMYVDKTHKMIIYRSRLISSMSKHEQDVWGRAHKDADIGFCENVNISPVLRASHNIGLVLYEKSECITAIESEKGLFALKRPFDVATHNVTCTEPIMAGTIGTHDTHRNPSILVYPLYLLGQLYTVNTFGDEAQLNPAGGGPKALLGQATSSELTNWTYNTCTGALHELTGNEAYIADIDDHALHSTVSQRCLHIGS